MDYKKENLVKLLEFIDLLLSKNENEWFKNELISRITSGDDANGDYASPLIDNIYLDLVRTKSYLKNIDRKIWIEGFNYYKTIKFAELKLELISDYKEMRIAEKQDDIIEYVRRMVMQIENCLNALIEIVDAYETIKKEPGKYKDEYNDLLTGKYAFFEGGKKKSSKDISLPSKMFFAKKFYGLKYYGKDFNEMKLIRNKSSHRGELTEREMVILENAKLNISERKAAYFRCFDSIITNIPDLFE